MAHFDNCERCVSCPTALSKSAIDEVVDLFGDAESISKLCHQCPANCALPATPIEENQTRWAGCFGWLVTDLNYSFDPAVEMESIEHPCLIGRVNEICKQENVEQLFRATATVGNVPRKAQPFYTLWQSNLLKPADALSNIT